MDFRIYWNKLSLGEPKEREKKKKSHVYEAAAVTHPHYCLLLKSLFPVPTGPTMLQERTYSCVTLGQSLRPHHLCGLQPTPGTWRREKGKDYVNEVLFASLMSLMSS